MVLFCRYEMLHGIGPFEGADGRELTLREVYERVTTHTKVTVDEGKFEPAAVDLLNRLLCPDHAARIGAGVGGAAKVRVLFELVE